MATAMKHSSFGTESQPSTPDQKQNVAREVMGLAEGKAATRAPKFHSMRIASAENGVSVDHTTKSNPSGPDTSTTHVFAHDHPVMKHIRAIHEHCQG